MAKESLANFLLLPELEFTTKYALGNWGVCFVAQKVSDFEVCSKCACASNSVYDHRWVTVRDDPIRGKAVYLRIKKRRFYCRPCARPFTESVHGISKYKRSTERFRRSLNWAAEKFSNLNDVCRAYRVSPGMVYKSVYTELELRRRKHTYPFPKCLGIDEHSIRKPKYREVDFATIFVDHSNKRVFDLVDGRDVGTLRAAVQNTPGKDLVKAVSIDMSTVYKSFIHKEFPNAKIIVDHFHVIRLCNKLVNYHRKKLTGDDRKNPVRLLLLRNSESLRSFERRALQKWLMENPAIHEVYNYKEAVRRIFRIKGKDRARLALNKLLDRMGRSGLKRVATLRKTLLNWRTEILNFHEVKISNGRTEGFNRKAKLLQRKAYGYKSFRNYRLRLLNACF